MTINPGFFIGAICAIAWLAGAFFVWCLCAGAAKADDRNGNR
jgi:hypothetical protein